MLSPLLTLTEKFYENNNSKKYIRYDDIKKIRNDLSHYNISIPQKTLEINNYVTQIIAEFNNKTTSTSTPKTKINQEAQDALKILKEHTDNNFISLFVYLTYYIPYEFIKITLDKFIAELENKICLLKIYNTPQVKDILYNINILKLILFVSKNLTSQPVIKLKSNYKAKADIVNIKKDPNPKYYKYKFYLTSNSIMLYIHEKYTGYFFDNNNNNKAMDKDNLDPKIKNYIKNNIIDKQKKSYKFRVSKSILNEVQDDIINQNYITDINTIPNEMDYKGNTLLLNNLKDDAKLKFYNLYKTQNQDLYNELDKLINNNTRIFILSDKILKDKCELEQKKTIINQPKNQTPSELIESNKEILNDININSNTTFDIAELNSFISTEDKDNLTNISVTENKLDTSKNIINIFNLNILLPNKYQFEFNKSKDINFLMFLHSMKNSNKDSILTATIKYNDIKANQRINLFASINNSNPQKEIYFYPLTHILDSNIEETLDINKKAYEKDKKKLKPFINFIKNTSSNNKHIILIPLSTLKKELFTIIKNNYTKASSVIQQINHFEREFFTNNVKIFKDKDNKIISYCDFLHTNLKSEYSNIFTLRFINDILKPIRNAALHFNEPKSKTYDSTNIENILESLTNQTIQEHQKTTLKQLQQAINLYIGKQN